MPGSAMGWPPQARAVAYPVALPPGAGTDVEVVETSVVVGGAGAMTVELGGIVEESILRSFEFTMTIVILDLTT